MRVFAFQYVVALWANMEHYEVLFTAMRASGLAVDEMVDPEFLPAVAALKLVHREAKSVFFRLRAYFR